MSVPAISVSTAKMTIDWDPNFSGTVTVSVRTTGCGTGSPSAYYDAVVEVVQETVPATDASDLIAPDAIPTTLCDGFGTGSKPVALSLDLEGLNFSLQVIVQRTIMELFIGK